MLKTTSGCPGTNARGYRTRKDCFGFRLVRAQCGERDKDIIYFGVLFYVVSRWATLLRDPLLKATWEVCGKMSCVVLLACSVGMHLLEKTPEVLSRLIFYDSMPWTTVEGSALLYILAVNRSFVLPSSS